MLTNVSNTSRFVQTQSDRTPKEPFWIAGVQAFLHRKSSGARVAIGGFSMNAPPPVRIASLAESVINVLRRDTWQGASIIAAQIAWPPEAVARYANLVEHYNSGRSRTESSSRSSLVCRALFGLFRTAQVERRKGKSGRWEYRLTDKGSKD